jgi:hypothetical protein
MQCEEIQRKHLFNIPSLITAAVDRAAYLQNPSHRPRAVDIPKYLSPSYKNGMLKDVEHCQLLLEIDRLMSIDPSEVQEESKFLLKKSF